jgi:hypothetical protein
LRKTQHRIICPCKPQSSQVQRPLQASTAARALKSKARHQEHSEDQITITISNRIKPCITALTAFLNHNQNTPVGKREIPNQ